MLLARSAWRDEHQAGQCVGLETNFVELGSYGVHIKIQEKGTPTKSFRKLFKILIQNFLLALGATRRKAPKAHSVTCKQLYK